ncbi:hypothetical protein [Prolixibacter sp. NT017]|uniref:hypothetical protein n=1 Tax=Prolixibacter sp. NT017 TaxID=2652390 RepID=UPI00126D2F50|nr:hypothetical protein [Prolixibacter sp. NT017]GET27683.1 hypothetical protein NT017_40120 [Prolixibacter sp. NT017]
MKTDKENIDNNFLNELQDSISIYKKSAPEMYLNFINIDTLVDAGNYINNLKPKSRYREYKKQILKFVEVLAQDDTLQKKDIVELNRIYLNSLIIVLKRDHGFKEKDDRFWAGAFNLALDLILIITGVAKYYYYVPVFTITAVIRNSRSIQRAKKENKYLDL